MSVALAPGIQLIMIVGVSIFTFLKIESSITRALSTGFSAGVSLRGRTCDGDGAPEAYVHNYFPKP